MKSAILRLCIIASIIFHVSAYSQTGSQSYTQTKYPIVMVPGAFAFDNVLGVVDYWYGITDKLRDQGAEVYVTNLSSSEQLITRGEELYEDIENILAITGAEKLNLVAHSQGATAARYVASLLPDRIASVSCFNCMNEGTLFADNLYKFVNKHRLVKAVVNTFLSGVFSALEVLSAGARDGEYNSRKKGIQIAEDLVDSAGTKSHANFNKLFPDGLSQLSCKGQNMGGSYEGVGGVSQVNDIRYFSIGGTASYTNKLDPLDMVLIPVIKLFYPKGHIWDGLVPSCGHPLGSLVEGFYPISHFDAINQAFGLVQSGVDIPSIYAIQANRLKLAGL